MALIAWASAKSCSLTSAGCEGWAETAHCSAGFQFRFEVSPSVRQVARLALPGSPYGLAYDAQRDRVWVTLTGRNEVVEIDTTTSPPTVLNRIPTVRQPNTVAMDAGTGRLFVTGTADGVLQLLEP